MIFASRNERGTLAADLVMAGRKTLTRREKPVAVGKILAVQPGRGKKAIGHVKVISCMSHTTWVLWTSVTDPTGEAEKEGFITWGGLLMWFKSKGIDINKTYRIEFEVVR